MGGEKPRKKLSLVDELRAEETEEIRNEQFDGRVREQFTTQELNEHIPDCHASDREYTSMFMPAVGKKALYQ